MPLYEYAPLSGSCDQCHGGFSVMQRMADAKLTQCPDCGQACERQLSAVALGGKYSMTPSAIASSGMTQYKRSGDGTYERTAGTGGPKTLRR